MTLKKTFKPQMNIHNVKRGKDSELIQGKLLTTKRIQVSHVLLVFIDGSNSTCLFLFCVLCVLCG